MATQKLIVFAGAATFLLVALSVSTLAQQSNQTTTHAPTPLPVTPKCAIITTKPNAPVRKFVHSTCIVAQFSAYFALGPSQYIELANATVNQDKSVCDNSTAIPATQPKLVIDFSCGSLALNINHVNQSGTFVQAISGEYFAQNASQITTFSNDSSVFGTSQPGHYYKCNTEQGIPVGPNLTIVFSNFALEAYRNISGTDFYQVPDECALDSQPVSDLVRIGVGVCLVALVAIVLVAYFVGRRRWSERSSYESV